MTREEALALVKEKVKTKNLVKHMLAVEAGMRALAPRFSGDPDRWALAGLLHDLDYEETKDAPDRHARVTVELLKTPESPMEWALLSVDPLTGLIVAAALVHPQRLAGLTPKNVLNRYKEKSFARSASRENIAACKNLGMELEASLAYDFLPLTWRGRGL